MAVVWKKVTGDSLTGTRSILADSKIIVALTVSYMSSFGMDADYV